MKSAIATSILSLWTISVFASSAALAQDSVDSTYARTQALGSFALGRDHPVTVCARVTRVHLQSADAYGYPDSDTLLVILDTSGKELYRESAYTALGGATTEFGCAQVNVPTLGSVLMCTTNTAPAMSTDGESFQLFGINSKGEFAQLSPPVFRLEHRIVFIDSRNSQRPVEVDTLLPYAKPAIEVEYWTDFYSAKVYHCIYPEGYSPGKQRRFFHFDKLPVSIDTVGFAQWRHEYQEGEIQVSLYPSPAIDNSRVQNVAVKPNSQVKFLYASYAHDWWLFISIDGIEGYLARVDCPKVGFPEIAGPTMVMLGDDY